VSEQSPTDALAELRQHLAALRAEVHALKARCAGLEEAELRLRGVLRAASEVIKRA
jgi:hypothetical protein